MPLANSLNLDREDYSMIGESLYHVAWQLLRPEIRRSESER